MTTLAMSNCKLQERAINLSPLDAISRLSILLHLSAKAFFLEFL